MMSVEHASERITRAATSPALFGVRGGRFLLAFAMAACAHAAATPSAPTPSNGAPVSLPSC